MRHFLLGVTAAFLLAGSVQGQGITIIGSGVGTSCGTWSADRSQRQGRDLEQWAIGYLSGAAVNGGINILGGTDFQGVMGWLDNYCRANPLTPLADALVAFVNLRARR